MSSPLLDERDDGAIESFDADFIREDWFCRPRGWCSVIWKGYRYDVPPYGSRIHHLLKVFRHVLIRTQWATAVHLRLLRLAFRREWRKRVAYWRHSCSFRAALVAPHGGVVGISLWWRAVRVLRAEPTLHEPDVHWFGLPRFDVLSDAPLLTSVVQKLKEVFL